MPRNRNKPVVPRCAWALVKPNGYIEVDTVGPTRKYAIMVECWGLKKVWASHRKQGWRVVKVEIREVAPDDR